MLSLPLPVPAAGYELVGLYLLRQDAPLPAGTPEIRRDFTASSFGNNNCEFKMPGYDAKVYAVFADHNAEFTVSFNTKGGTPVPAQQRVKYGKYATKPAQNPFLPGGFTFYSWHYNQNGFNFNE